MVRNENPMKRQSPFHLLQNIFSTNNRHNELSTKLLNKNREDFWEKECKDHPTSQACILYED